MTNEEKDLVSSGASDRAERSIAVLCLLLGIPAFIVVAHFAGEGRGRAAGLCLAVDALVVILRRKSTRKIKLWSATLLMLLFQTIVIVAVPFGDQSLPAYGLLPAALVIYLIDEGILYLIGLFGARSDPSPK